ncbi:MAG: protein TolR [Desulfovibrio sp.]|jgi:biopolymer transport protein TolR|nr:protein TolR [Desulfovibrio sp.]
MAGISPTDDFVSEINVTPFVDVMLVLLIIFMVTAPLMTEGLAVDLPRVETSEILPAENDHMILTIKSDGALFLDEYETAADDLAPVLRTNVRDSGRQLFVRADKTVPYGVVMEVMGRIRGCGITDVGLVTVSAPGPEGKKENSPTGAGNVNAVQDGAAGWK